ncbi:GNAT family N-acetyltransferase [Kitasatospora sp. NPDC127067]|uniref:GNAT family N-acetyltransferase n=1 Tax=Kitasatospora sp. NPDC127067 TaxID=3347126 RepID=UPI00364AEF1B
MNSGPDANGPGRPAEQTRRTVEFPSAGAERADVRIRSLRTVPELQQADAVLRTVWNTPDIAEPPLALDVMCALAHTGGYVAAAYLGTAMVGVTAGFRTIGDSLHSHVAGVLPGMHGRGIGAAMKSHQREWAARAGLSSISWTYDPLIRRNAHFNLRRLGAVAEAYLPDFYGPLADGINDGDDSDRLFVSWPVHGTPHAPAPLPDLAAAEPVLEADGNGEPVPRAATGGVLRCVTPVDAESLRRTDPAAARRWRSAMRQALGGALENGYRIDGFDRSGWYVLRRKETSE